MHESQASTHSGRLLVVDDNEMNRDMLSRRLARRGFEVITAEDGPKALELVAAGPFDLVLLDIMMPGMDGREVLRRLRQSRPPTELPVIMATAKDQREDVVESLGLGANDYVTKPLDFPVVMARVETQLSLKRAVDEIKALKLDLQRQNQALQEANTRMKRDLLAAARVQQALLPSEDPGLPGVRFAWTFKPCDELGGDILNVFRIGSSHAGFYLLDVSGHGVSAALLSVTLSRVLMPLPGQASLVVELDQAGDPTPRPPAFVVSELNRRFQLGDDGQYFTILYGVLDSRSGELRYVSAGHPGPIHAPAGGPAGVVQTTGFPVGWVPDATYDEEVLKLGPGDRLYAYSDGITEAMNHERALFGQPRLVESIAAGRSGPLDESLSRLVQDAERWAGRPFNDDVTALSLERGK